MQRPNTFMRSQMAAVHAALGQPEPFQLLYAWAPPAPACAWGADPPAPPSATQPDPASGSASLGIANPIKNPSMGPGCTGVLASSSGDHAEAGLARGLGPGSGSGAACGVHVSQADQGLGLGSGLAAGPKEHAGAPGGSPVQMLLLQRWAATAVAGGGCQRGGSGSAFRDAKPGGGADWDAWVTKHSAMLGAGPEAAASGAGGEAMGCSGLTNLPDIELELDLGLSSSNPVRPCGSQPCATGGAAGPARALERAQPCGSQPCATSGTPDPARALERAQPCGGTARAAGPGTADPEGFAGTLAAAGRRVLGEAGARSSNSGAEPGPGSGSGPARCTQRGRENQAPAATGGGAAGAARTAKGSGPWKDADGEHIAQHAAQLRSVRYQVAGGSPAAGLRQSVGVATAAPDTVSPAARPTCRNAQGHAKPAVEASHAAAASRGAVAGLPSAPSSPGFGLASLFGGGGSPPGWACSPPAWGLGLELGSPDQGALTVHTLAAQHLAATAARGLTYPEPDPDPQAPSTACARSPPAGALPGDVSGEAPQAHSNPGGAAGRAKRCRPRKQRALKAPQADGAHTNPGVQGAPAAGKDKKKRKGAPAGSLAAEQAGMSAGPGSGSGLRGANASPAALEALRERATAVAVAEPGSELGSRGSNTSPAALEALRERAAAAAAAAEAAAREYAEALAGGACAKASPKAGSGPCQGQATADLSLGAWAPRGKAAGAPGAAPDLAPAAAAASSKAGDEAGACAHPRAHPKTRHGARKRTRCADGGAGTAALAARRAPDPTNPVGARASGRPGADGAPAGDPTGSQVGLQAGGKRPCGPALQLHRLFDDMPEAAAVLASLPGGGGSGGGADGADAVGEVGPDQPAILPNPKLPGAAGEVGMG